MTSQTLTHRKIDKTADTVWVDGREYTITRYPEGQWGDTDRKEDPKKSECEKLLRMSPERLRFRVTKELRKEKEVAHREHLGIANLSPRIKKENVVALTVTDKEISEKIRKLHDFAP